MPKARVDGLLQVHVRRHSRGVGFLCESANPRDEEFAVRLCCFARPAGDTDRWTQLCQLVDPLRHPTLDGCTCTRLPCGCEDFDFRDRSRHARQLRLRLDRGSQCDEGTSRHRLCDHEVVGRCLQGGGRHLHSVFDDPQPVLPVHARVVADCARDPEHEVVACFVLEQERTCCVEERGRARETLDDDRTILEFSGNAWAYVSVAETACALARSRSLG